MHRLSLRFALLAAFAAAASLPAQTELSFTPGENKTAPVVLDVDNTPFTFRVDTGTATQSGSISESGGSFDIWKDGAGTLVLGNANTYTGNTLIANGALETGISGALSTGLVYLGGFAALHLTGGSHTVAGLNFNLAGDPNGSAPFLVVSGGAQLTSTGALTTVWGEGSPRPSFVVTGSGSKLTASYMPGDFPDATLSYGGVLELTLSGAAPRLGTLNLGAAAGQTAVEAGRVISGTGSNFISADTLQFNHTATSADPYWFTTDGTANGVGFSSPGGIVINSGATNFKSSPLGTGGALVVNGGEARFQGPADFTFITMSGGMASFEGLSQAGSSMIVTVNQSTLQFRENLTLGTKVWIHGTSGTIDVAAGKTLTIMPPTGNYEPFSYHGSMPFNEGGSFVKQGAGTLFLKRDRASAELEDKVASFTVRNGTLRAHDFVFDEMVIGQQAGDDGYFTASPVDSSIFPSRKGIYTSLGFAYVNYWHPRYDSGILLEIWEGNTMLSDLAVIQSRNLTLGQQAGATGTLTLNEAVGGWYVDSGPAVIGDAGTGHVTLVDNFLYNNGGNIVVGRSAGGLGNVLVSGVKGQLNAGVDLVPLDVYNWGGEYYPYYPPNEPFDHGTGNILIGQGGIGHVTVTNHARILAAQTFIGNGSNLTLGSGGTIYGGFTAQNGSTVHALDGATFAFTLGSVTEASAFEAGSTFLVDANADLIFAITQGTGFGLGTYTLFTFAGGTTLTGLDDAVFSATGLNGYSYAFDLTSAGLNLTVSAIPEPSTYAMLAGAMALGFVIARRRKLLF